jgi:hypothetical protein
MQDQLAKDAAIALYEQTEAKSQENDYNKYFYFKFFERLTENNLDAVAWLSKYQIFFKLWISLREAPIGFGYINPYEKAINYLLVYYFLTFDHYY